MWADRPLSLVLVFKENSKDKNALDAAKLLMYAVCSYSSRWVLLDVRCPSSLMLPVARAVSANSSALIDLFLELSDHRKDIVDESPVITTSTSPKLKSLHIEGDIKLQLKDADLMCKHLKNLSYHQNIHRMDLTLSLNDAYKALACCPKLESFDFTVRNDEQFSPPTNEPRRGVLYLPNLVNLSLNTFYEADIGPLLVSLCAGNLKQLVINGPFTGARDDWNYLYDFLDHSRPPLASLSVVGIEITSTAMVRCGS